MAREKKERLVIGFDTTSAAAKAEEVLLKSGSKGCIIPVPREITAGCGLAWCAPLEERENALQELEKNGVTYAGVYSIMMY